MLSFLRRHLILSLGALALFAFIFSEAVFALPVRLLTWEPERLAPSSIAPGEEVTYTAIFTPTLPVPKVESLTASLTGPAADFLTSLTVDLPTETGNTLRGGTSVPVRLAVRVPLGAVVGSYPGTLTLRYGEDGLPLLFAPDLAVELTVSTVPVPPDPGKAGKETIAGIDVNTNGVRDDVERFIVFSYNDITPEHENTRNALFQYAGAAQEGLMNAADKVQARAEGEELDQAQNCLWAVRGTEEGNTASSILTAQMFNTVARTRQWSMFNQQLSGLVSVLETNEEILRGDCSFEIQ
ncbi:MAG: hypothetical protein Q8R39_00980 [bacterium]|nr:hypothetical protein [bacterium]MDZ4285159.1 hypothetical protein [Patescibacteria group bacterium]